MEAGVHGVLGEGAQSRVVEEEGRAKQDCALLLHLSMVERTVVESLSVRRRVTHSHVQVKTMLNILDKTKLSPSNSLSVFISFMI